MARKSGVFSRADQARDAAIRSAIGRTLRAQYDLAESLPERLAGLVKRLENPDECRNSLQRAGAWSRAEEPASS
jgi:hypothetical protein